MPDLALWLQRSPRSSLLDHCSLTLDHHVSENNINSKYEILEALPYELIQVIVSQVTDIKDLRSLALVNKLFRELAEPGIYRDVLIRYGYHATSLVSSIFSNPVRATWIRSVRSACHMGWFDGLPELLRVIPLMTRLWTLVVETPDCNNERPEKRLLWIGQQEAYRSIFFETFQPSSRVLSGLRSCTLHFVDKHRSLYSLGHYSVLFVHPTLTHLNISCASIDPPRDLHPLVLQPSRIKTTPLKVLDLIECDFDPSGLYQLLHLPRKLTSLTLTEADKHAYYADDCRYSGLSTPNILHPISDFQPHLRNLRIARSRFRKETLFSLPKLDLTPFSELSSVEFAHVRGSRYVLPQAPDYCEFVHRAGPQQNTGAPYTVTLTYSDIPMQWWKQGITFLTCAFKNKVSHDIEKLKTLRLVLVDDELVRPPSPVPLAAAELKNRDATFQLARELVRQLGELGRRPEVGIRVIVDWIRPTGFTIPPYLTGENVPEEVREYDSGPIDG